MAFRCECRHARVRVPGRKRRGGGEGGGVGKGVRGCGGGEGGAGLSFSPLTHHGTLFSDWFSRSIADDRTTKMSRYVVTILEEFAL